MKVSASCFPFFLRENRAGLKGSLRRLSVLGIVALVAACEGALPALNLDSIRPNVAAADRDTTFLIKGSFYAPLGADLGSGRQFLRDDFVAELGGVALSDVTLLSSTELAATMPPGLIEGSNDLVVRDPLGREAVLARAVQVLPPDGSAPSVTIDSPDDGSLALAGQVVEVTYTVTDNPPGVVTGVRMTVSGAVSADDETEPAIPVNSFSGTFHFQAQPVAEGVRDIAILIQAWDDAPSRNEGNAWINLTLDLCDSEGECDDGSFCNGVEACVDGVCVAGEPFGCDDGIECTVDTCDEAFRSCLHDPRASACDNGVFCDGAEICDPGVGCVPGHDPCDDGVDCTIDTCQEALMEGESGVCRSRANDLLCDDGLFCNGEEACEPDAEDADEQGCVAGADPCPEDHIECTRLSCDEMSASCQVQVYDDLCSDNIDCTIDLCDKELGCQNPPGTEGPRGDPSCSDGLDNDCDDRVDAVDPDC
jgi:hypothetical protein